jgi:hypothetical protein
MRLTLIGDATSSEPPVFSNHSLRFADWKARQRCSAASESRRTSRELTKVGLVNHASLRPSFALKQAHLSFKL